MFVMAIVVSHKSNIGIIGLNIDWTIKGNSLAKLMFNNKVSRFRQLCNHNILF
jgi:hypothetical protein